jgi:sialate O-acetylesterase
MFQTGLKLSPIFCDGMILQRDTINRIYGEETLAETVTISFMGEEYSTKVYDNCEFSIEIPPVPAGGPYTMTIQGSSRITISDILFGDVYILSGQSNMELPIRRVLDVSAEEISKTSEQNIRQYLIPATYNFHVPEKYMYAGSWKKAMGSELMDFSAAGYFFAKEIKDTYQVPVGLILTAVGGCGIESWMSPAALHRFGEYEKEIECFKNIDYFNHYIQEQNDSAGGWSSALRDEELKFDFDDSFKDWDTCLIPSLVSDYGVNSFNGSVYLCREIELASEPVGSDMMIYMGSMIDSDEIWINGQTVGKTDYRYPPRKYPIREGILKKGKNLITVRLVINNQNGGTVKGKPYYLSYSGKKINLEGEWYYRIGKKADNPMPSVLFPPTLPICFYNTVVVPLSKISIKGILWYQGEHNTSNPVNYSEKFAAMVSDWRELSGWEVPFIYVQLANYREPLNTEEDTGWAELRYQQTLNLSLYNVAMAVTLDIGEGNDLHPQNKKELGIRLAKAAKYLIYNETIVHSGPIPVTADVSGKNMEVEFMYLENSEKELDLNNFEIAGRDGVYHKANAIRKGSYVSVSCKEVASPVSVRYAWSDNPTEINFYNDAGLPAAGFRMTI